MIVPGPFNGTSAQSFGVDLYVFKCGAQLARSRGPARALERCFQHKPADPTFGHLLGGVARAALLHFLDDFPMHREIVLEQRVGTNDVESRVLKTRQPPLLVSFVPARVLTCR